MRDLARYEKYRRHFVSLYTDTVWVRSTTIRRGSYGARGGEGGQCEIHMWFVGMHKGLTTYVVRRNTQGSYHRRVTRTIKLIGLITYLTVLTHFFCHSTKETFD